MSFSFEFTAKINDVPALTDAQYAPDCVKEFIRLAVRDLPADLVYIKAYGHLYNKDYQTSTCTLEIRPFVISQPNKTS